MNPDHRKQKNAKIWYGSELVPGDGMNSDHVIMNKNCKNMGGVRAGPKRWDELGPLKREIRKNLGGVRAGPRRWDELGPPKAKNCAFSQKWVVHAQKL